MKSLSSRSTNIDRVALPGVVLLLGGLFLVHSSRTIDPDVLPRFVFLAAVLSVSLVAVTLILRKQKRVVETSVLKNGVTLVWLAGVAAAGASILVALNRSEALFGCARLFDFFVLFVLLASLLSRDGAMVETLAAVLSVFCLVLGLVGAIQLASAVGAHGWTLKTTYLVHGLSAHRNFLSQILLLTLPFAVYEAFVGRRLRRAVSLGAIVLAAGLITVLMARSVWIAAVVGFLMTSVLWWFVARKRGGRWMWLLRRMVLVISGLLLALVIVALLVLGHAGRTSLESRLQTLANPSHGSAGGRLFLWNQTVRMALDHPLLGVGSGNWRIVFPKYAGNKQMMRNIWKTPRRPHNDYLWILAERGAAGLLAYLAVIGTLLWLTGGVVVAAEDVSTALLGAALFFAQVAYLTFSLFSFPSERIGLSALRTAILAMAFGLHIRLAPKTRKLRRSAALGLAVIALVLVVGSLFAGAVRMRSEEHVRMAYRDLKLARYREALADLDAGQSPLYTVDRSGFPVQLYRAAALTALGENDQARHALIEARRASPYNVLVLDRLALSFARLGNTAEAIRTWQMALKIHPDYPPAVRGLAVTAGQHQSP